MNAKPKTFLVALNLKKPTNALFRQLQAMVNPGDRIEFLVAYRHEIVPWFTAHVAMMQTGLHAAVSFEERRAGHLWDERKNRLEQDIALPARKVFSRLGVEVAVNLYWGSLNRTINRYLENGEVTLVFGRASWIRRLIIARARLTNWFLRHPPNYTFNRLMLLR